MQDWAYPYEVHKIALSDSLEIAYIDEEEGEEVLLFIHGLGSYLKAWQKNIDSLKMDYRCIALDLPGYGKSSKGNYPFDMTFFAETIRAFIEALNLKKVTLVGHSMGGQIAMHTVLKHNPHIEKLILIAPAGFELFTNKEKQWFQNVYTAAVIKATSEEQIRKNFKINFYNMPEDAQFMIEDRLFMRQTVEYDPYCAMIPKCVLGMLEEPIFDRLSEITLPTLVLFGENDLLIPNKLLHPNLNTLEVAKSASAHLSKGTLKMIPSAGHFVQWEQAELVNEAILKFLEYGVIKR